MPGVESGLDGKNRTVNRTRSRVLVHTGLDLSSSGFAALTQELEVMEEDSNES